MYCLVDLDSLGVCQTIKQSTKGNQSPAVSTKSGHITITYGMAEETIEAMKQYMASKDMEIQELKKRLAEIHKNEFSSLPTEADEWATQFLATLPLRKDQLMTAQQDKKQLLETEKAKITMLFDFILQSFDVRLDALIKRGSKIRVKDKLPVGTLPLLDCSTSTIRSVVFTNGRTLDVILICGSLKQGAINHYPKITFRFLDEPLFTVMHSSIILNIGNVKPQIPELMYTLNGDVISDAFKSKLFSAYDKLFEMVFVN